MEEVGTPIKFEPVLDIDTIEEALSPHILSRDSSTNQLPMLENGDFSISTRNQCITAMKEYEGKSLEELRWEDYLVNRKSSNQ